MLPFFVLLFAKTLLSRPINMREIGIDAFGNVETISKLEFDKSAISK